MLINIFKIFVKIYIKSFLFCIRFYSTLIIFCYFFRLFIFVLTFFEEILVEDYLYFAAVGPCLDNWIYFLQKACHYILAGLINGLGCFVLVYAPGQT